jgi:protein SCO1
LIERSGKQVSLADLRGKIWIADFIYTHCTDTCPLQTADMAKLQDRWLKEPKVELVSFSVDPEHDTPQVLSRYAGRFKADPKRWLFLTGHRPEIVRLA